MSPALPALALVACLAVAVRGVLMLRVRTPAALDSAQAAALERGERTSVLGRLIVWLNERLAPQTLRLLGPRRIEKIRRRLDSAGQPMTVEAYAGRRATLFALMASTGLLLWVGAGTVVPLVLLGVYGFFAQDIVLSRQARLRQEEIDRTLPDFLDVLSVSVSAGVAFRPALRRVADAQRGAMGEEALTALRQMELGASRREAFESLRRRNGSAFISQFVTALLQAEELGVPFAEALVDIAREMRRESYQRGRRRAARAAPRVSLIVSMLIVPGALVLLIGALFVGSDFDLGGLSGG